MTIEGCVTWPSGGITFAGYACDDGDYTGCIVWTGEHAGQVAVEVVEANCDDTYYGCVDWADDGKFKVEIPDDCCITPGYDCGICEAGTTPAQIDLTISDLVLCEGCVGDDYNSVILDLIQENIEGTWRVSQRAEEYPCEWVTPSLGLAGNFGVAYGYGNDGCSGIPATVNLNRILIHLGLTSYGLTIWIQIAGPYPYFSIYAHLPTLGNYPPDSNCVTSASTATHACGTVEGSASNVYGASSAHYEVAEV